MAAPILVGASPETLAGINEAYERTVKGDVKYRFVIDCTKF